MLFGTLLASQLTTSWFSTQILGEAVLISVGAIVIGYLVALYWPKEHNPSLFGSLAAIALVGALAYLGNAGAALAIFIVIIVCAVLAFTGVF